MQGFPHFDYVGEAACRQTSKANHALKSLIKKSVRGNEASSGFDTGYRRFSRFLHNLSFHRCVDTHAAVHFTVN